jgi:hypothetical protein
MTASIIPGVNLLLLNVPPPTETDNVTPRDDLLALKVWYSLTPNFNEITQGTLAYEGPGLSATIAGLTPSVNYYVKYALISDIDPSVYDISDELVAQPIALEEAVDPTPPPTPTNVVLSVGINTILISHDTPTYTQGKGHRRTLVFGKVRNAGSPVPTYNDVDVRVVTEFTGSVTSFASEPGTTWHFWLKWLTNDGVLSTIASGGINGHTATTGQDVTKLLEVLNGEITESQLYSTLTGRINLIDDPSTGLVNKIQTLSTTVAGPDGATAQYTVKTDVNGNVAGFGLSNTVNTAGAATSEFVIVADKFAIAPVNTNNTADDGSPFFHRTSATTINGVEIPAGTYMKAAFIHDASITNAKIANLSADKITAGFISADRIAAGSIVADKIDTRGLSIKDTAGNIIFAAGTALNISNISGLGTLATQNSVSYASVTGTKPPTNADNTASNTAAGIANQGSFATVNQITQSNAAGLLAPNSIASTYIASLTADKISVTNLASINANLGTVTAGRMQSPDGQFVIDLTNKFISITV